MLTKTSETMRVLMVFITMLFFSQVLSGCVTTGEPKNTTQIFYASLASATSVYNSTHDLVTQLGRTGKLDQDQKIEIKAFMIEAEIALIGAGVALDAYIGSATDANSMAFDAQILAINQLVIQITGVIGGI